jgi:hypothetical protein
MLDAPQSINDHRRLPDSNKPSVLAHNHSVNSTAPGHPLLIILNFRILTKTIFNKDCLSGKGNRRKLKTINEFK